MLVEASFSGTASRPHAERALAGRAQRRGEIGKLAQQPARLARIDDFLNQELLGGAERRGELLEPRFDLGELRGRISGCFKLGLVRRLQSAGNRQRAPFTRRSGVTNVEAPGRLVRGAGDAEGAAHDD